MGDTGTCLFSSNHLSTERKSDVPPRHTIDVYLNTPHRHFFLSVLPLSEEACKIIPEHFLCDPLGEREILALILLKILSTIGVLDAFGFRTSSRPPVPFISSVVSPFKPRAQNGMNERRMRDGRSIRHYTERKNNQLPF